MGLENGLLNNAQLSSSSFHDWNHGAEDARIGQNSWVAGKLDDNQYLQINFLEPRNISAVVTQGREDIEQWVTAYSVSYSNDGTNWNSILDEKGNPQIFPGNFDSVTKTTAYLPQMLRAQYIRIIPKRWNNWISLKLEILGCFHPYLSVMPTTIGESVLSNKVTTVEPYSTCREPMGLRDKLLPDHLLYVSSAVVNSGASRLRLNTITENGKTGGWVPGMEDEHPYAQIDFVKPSTLTGIITQGKVII
ncbi:EGF-like repeat and discoidin I-like domain-containing protein 3 [Centruroides sculpturatus]|uniref:EGF-like repeat and discoidin I-like domain-containing protein 3 n=1 Tax=Centruroides sculpturatus TaxID=218467 RepID=UPI000C6E6A3B|nr:EGF-like repeat and discoidin I-like domain-containing protein 3 [Centruroides sculpturatus]